MTKKDYELIAEVIKDVYEYQKENDGRGSRALKQGAIRVVAQALSYEFSLANKKFDPIKFERACGILED